MKTTLLGAALAIALTPAVATATTFPVGSPNFFLTSGTPFTPSITATFYNSFSSTTSFDDTFAFTIPQNGTGSGSVSTSFSGSKTKLVITSVLVNGVSIPVIASSGGYSATVTGVPIVAFMMNTIEVIGTVKGSGVYSGTATFEAAAVPEPATWAMTIGGIGLLGAALRRRRAVAVSYS